MKSRRRQILRLVATGLTVMAAFALVGSAYAGFVDPRVWAPAGLINMGFPIMAVLSVALLLVLGLMRSRLACVTAVALLVATPSLLLYSPVNMPVSPESLKEKKTFTLMTFNSLHWDDYDMHDPPIVPNPSLQYVIDMNPDLLVVQESEPTGVRVSRGITPAMSDTIDARYPYSIVDRLFTGQALYSKYPVTRIVTQDSICGTAVMAAYRVSIQGHLLTIYNLHLQSLLLSPEDKALYSEVTRARGGTSGMRNVRDHIFTKLYDAFRLRADQADVVRGLLDSIRGNAIVCGDFNDTPGCFALRTILGNDMHDAFVETALGPKITYHKNKFYFRIDHIAYRGDFHAVDIVRGTDVVSDHYPLMATFVWDDSRP